MPFALFVLLTFSIAAGTIGLAWALSSRPRLAIATGGLGAAGLMLLIGPGYFDCFIDDAYITYRYSDHLANGLGPNWNSTGRVEGYTNFSMMGILAGLAKLGFDIPGAAPVVGFLAVLATFAAVYAIWQRWALVDPSSGLSSPVLPVTAFVGLALTDGTTFWGFSGMETPLFMAALTGGAFLAMRERDAGGLPLSAVAFAAGAMTRPEGLIAAAVTGLFIASRIYASSNRHQALLQTVLWATTFFVLYGSYFLWRYAYYDHLLPNTFYAKVGSTAANYERGIDYVWKYGLRYHVLTLLAGASLLLARPRLRDDVAYVLALIGAMITGIVIEGADSFLAGRFMLPLLPLVYLAGLAGLAAGLRHVTMDGAARGFGVTAVVGLGMLSFYPGLSEQIPCRSDTQLDQRRVLGEWLTEHTPEDFVVAGYAIGALGYYTERDMLDLFGINDVAIAHTDVPDLGAGIAGHEKFNNAYVLETVRPEIIVPSDAEGRAVTTEEFRARFGGPAPNDRLSLFYDQRLWAQYEVRSLSVGGYWFNFLQRSDTVADLQAPGLR